MGIGQPEHAQRYCGRLAPGVICLTDETTDSHATYGLRQVPLRSLTSLGMVKATARALSAGHRQGQATGDVKMLPGTFLVDRDGIIRYTYYSQHAGDDPDIHDLIQFGQGLRQQTPLPESD